MVKYESIAKLENRIYKLNRITYKKSQSLQEDRIKGNLTYCFST